MTFAAGYEFTFTNERSIAAGKARGEIELDTPENLAACEAFAAAIRAAIGDHEYGTEDDGFGFTRHVFTYPDGYWIKLELDPWVVEITGKHMTLDGYLRMAPRLDQIFAVAASIGLTPHERIGGGHVHICRSSFAGDPVALRNFIVDYFNHPELALGVLGWDVLNASPLSGAPEPAIASFIDGLARFDAGQLDLHGFLQHLRLKVYTYCADGLPPIAVLSKYQALSVDHPSTVEIRGIRPQRNFAEYLAVLELFRARIAFLAGRPPLPYRYERWPSTEPMPPALARARFASYLAEMQMQHWSREGSSGASAKEDDRDGTEDRTMVPMTPACWPRIDDLSPGGGRAMKALGTHVLAELYECDRAALDDHELIRAAMLEAARRCEATIITDCFHRFSPHGVSGVVVIAESHLAIHTWPEYGYAAVDLFTCGEGLRAEAGLSHLGAALGSRHQTVHTALRGSHPAAAAAAPAHQPARGREGLTITLINGALGGGGGNTAAMIAPPCDLLRRCARVHEVHLATDPRSTAALEPLLLESDGFIFATGTYWDSWGSPLQAFLEGTTRLESGRAWLGKPAAVVVSMHSVGGKGVLSRLQGVLSTLGCAIPPMSGMVYSLATDLAVRHAPAEAAPFLADFWQLDELEVVCHNLLEAASGGAAWRTWRVDDGDPARRWMPGGSAP